MVGASAGKSARITFIRDLLGLAHGPAGQVRYQVPHRIAAAVPEATRFKADRAAMIVQSLSGEHRWFEDVAAFAALLGPGAERDVPMRHTLPSGKPPDRGCAVGSDSFP